MVLSLRGLPAIAYAEQLGGSICLRKFVDPIECERRGIDLDERVIAREDPPYQETAAARHWTRTAAAVPAGAAAWGETISDPVLRESWREKLEW